MAPPSSRTDASLNLNLSGLSTITEPNSSATNKSPFSGPKTGPSALSGLAGARLGAGSPLHEQGSRLLPKRARELQTPTGVSSNIWGPPTSGTSTPLFEIPESPSQDGFPDLIPLTETGINSPARRGRAGTLPSRISPSPTATPLPMPSLTSKTSRPTPSTSPFRPGSTSASEQAFNSVAPSVGSSALLSRLRAGSMPQRASLFGNNSILAGQGAFGQSWNPRARAATLTSISSAEDPTSPQQSALGKEDPAVRTLDYLGLAETPASNSSRLADLDSFGSAAAQQSLLSSLNSKNASRFRSFSVNTSNQYPAEAQDSSSRNYPLTASGAMTPAALEAEYEAIQERVRLHNKAVQDFALNASAARPRARTAGLVDTPQRSALGRYAPSMLSQAERAAVEGTSPDAAMMGAEMNSHELSAALYNLNLADRNFNLGASDQTQSVFDVQDESHAQISRSLWIGSIPNSTTISTLDTIFSSYGPIESTRVLTHKNCGFVNFENVQDAVRARQLLNGKEIFPGNAPVRIGFAKAPSNSVTPGPGPTSQSPAPILLAEDGSAVNPESSTQQRSDQVSTLSEMRDDILRIVSEFDAQNTDLSNVSNMLDSSITYSTLQKEIPSAQEPSSTRVFDAPRLRDIRKRIDNGQCQPEEIEQIAIEMLPEIAELSSDYLGNTVVQKLFEFCSEPVKEQMLGYIAPHLAEIGIHKNGTWAAQKIIDVCKSESQILLIVEHLRPYTIPLFLDQFGNYVLQCCLRFGSMYNNFIFETMASHLWEVSQGRFGARAMRACLESHHASKDQQRMLAAVIALRSTQLATNANGALLLTWLLDTCTFPKRRTVLAPRLIPHLVQLCTHKVAYLTVLKVVNQRNEPEAREEILNALFFGPGETVLEQILSDHSSGVTCIFKILTSPFLDDNIRPDVMRNISNVLVRIKAQPNQGYKRLMDEVGLSSRVPPMGPSFASSHNNSGDRARPMSQMSNSQFGGEYPMGINVSAMNNGFTPARSVSSDSYSFPSYNMNGYTPQHQNYNNGPYSQLTPQSHQYQNYNAPGPRNNNGYMSNGVNNPFASYNTPPNTVDAFRGMPNQSASPVPFQPQMSPMMNTGGFAQPYAQQGMNGNMYGYGGNGVQQSMYSFSPQMQPVHAGGRARRVRS